MNQIQKTSDGCKRFVMHADEKLTAFLELESAIRDTQHLPNFPCNAAESSGKKSETV